MICKKLQNSFTLTLPLFHIRVSTVFVLWFSCFATIFATSSSASTNQVLSEQRKHYLAAKDALDKRRMKSFRWHRNQLTSYPLKPYLDYYELNRRLSRLPFDDVEKFLTQQEGSLLASRLRKKWLYQLAIKKQWNSFRTYFVDDYTDTGYFYFLNTNSFKLAVHPQEDWRLEPWRQMPQAPQVRTAYLMWAGNMTGQKCWANGAFTSLTA